MQRNKAQGTIEYLVIIAIVVVIALVVVSILTGFLSTGNETGSQSKQISALTGEFSASEFTITTDGNYILNIKNNSDTVTITNVEVIDQNNQPFTYTLSKSKSQNFIVYTDQTCTEGMKQTATIKISYTTKQGLTKTSWLEDMPFDCVNYTATNTANNPTPTEPTCDYPSFLFENECNTTCDTNSETGFFTGAGTSEDPYTICSWEQLNNIRTYTSLYFELITSLDETSDDYDIYASPTANSNIGWGPITTFDGNFNGNGNTIKELFINNVLTRGFFNTISSTGSITNVIFEDLNVTSQSYTGGIVGYNYGTIEQVQIINSKILGYTRVGGIAGRNYGLISKSSYDGNVQSTYYGIGGLVGENASPGTISQSIFIGNVTSTHYAVGGIAGYNNASSSIEDCYAIGTMQGSSMVGGLVGSNSAPLVRSFFVGTTSNSSLIGTGNVSNIENSYFDCTVFESDCGTTGKITSELKDYLNYSEWDFETIWGINNVDPETNNDGYPFLRWQNYTHNYAGTTPPTIITLDVEDVEINSSNASYSNANLKGRISDLGGFTDLNFYFQYKLSSASSWTSATKQTNITESGDFNLFLSNLNITDSYDFRAKIEFESYSLIGNTITFIAASPFSIGSGTSLDPFQIDSCEKLQAIGANSSTKTKYYILNQNIDCQTATHTGGALWNSGDGFLPISSFSGIIDGNNNAISNLFINRSSSDNIGLIGNGGTIRDVNLIDVDITGGNYVGGGIGRDGTAINLYVSGSVNSGLCAGGICGCFCNVSSSINAANIYGTGQAIGGITGYLVSNTVTNSYNLGTVSGTEYVGGITGYAEGASLIENSYNKGNITGTSGLGETGGIAGHNASNITYCYNTGTITGTTAVGGIIGNNAGGTIYNSYNSGSIIGNSNLGGVIGQTSDSTGLNDLAWLTSTSTDAVGIVGDFAACMADNPVSCWDYPLDAMCELDMMYQTDCWMNDEMGCSMYSQCEWTDWGCSSVCDAFFGDYYACNNNPYCTQEISCNDVPGCEVNWDWFACVSPCDIAWDDKSTCEMYPGVCSWPPGISSLASENLGWDISTVNDFYDQTTYSPWIFDDWNASAWIWSGVNHPSLNE
ncbi:MAG: GLUG motif-containing protein [archaeon]|jgi:hypothetical protein